MPLQLWHSMLSLKENLQNSSATILSRRHMHFAGGTDISNIAAANMFPALLSSIPCSCNLLCRYKQRQVRKEEEREKAFERVFNDPDVDLEEVAAQVLVTKRLSCKSLFRC